MKITIICNELPLPATHGGRIDVWRRILALKSAGAQIHLITWVSQTQKSEITPDIYKLLENEISKLTILDISNSITSHISRFVYIWRWPAHTTIRVPNQEALHLIIKDTNIFSPDLIFLDGLYGGALALRLAEILKINFVYRSHNIEHSYMRQLYKRSSNPKAKLAIFLNIPALHKFENLIIRKCIKFFDISMTDLIYWKNLGYKHGEWLPPIMDNTQADKLSTLDNWTPEFDIGYLGNLYSANNVEGILWFLKNVVPQLLLKRPETKIFIAGLKPSSIIIGAARSAGITLISDPPNATPILRNAKILINPIFSGSGVNIKSVEMLFTPAIRISTNQGLTGLPPIVLKQFIEANTVHEFVEAILREIKNPTIFDDFELQTARGLFSMKQGNQILATLKNLKMQNLN